MIEKYASYVLQLIYESVHFGMLEQQIATNGDYVPMLRSIIASEVNMVSSKMASVTKDAPENVQEINDAYRELYRKMSQSDSWFFISVCPLSENGFENRFRRNQFYIQIQI